MMSNLKLFLRLIKKYRVFVDHCLGIRDIYKDIYTKFRKIITSTCTTLHYFRQRMLGFLEMPRKDRAASNIVGTTEAGNYVHGMMNRPKYFVEHHWTRGGRR